MSLMVISEPAKYYYKNQIYTGRIVSQSGTPRDQLDISDGVIVVKQV